MTSSKPDESFCNILETTEELITMYKELEQRTAHKYPFQLDPYQQLAVLCIERGHSVLVCAPTKTGKTLVAEWAARKSIQNKKRLVYASPIKALCNQKISWFRSSFGTDNVGSAMGTMEHQMRSGLVVMTIDKLRSIIFSDPKYFDDVEWVVFDELHYLLSHNNQRGHLWEEALILLPRHVKIILLSLPARNADEVADWVGCLKYRRVQLVTSFGNPIPSELWIFIPNAGRNNNPIRVVTTDNEWLLHRFQEAKLAAASAVSGPAPHYGGFQKYVDEYRQLIHHLKSCGLFPAVVYVFSRKRCDDYAGGLIDVDLTTAYEKNMISQEFGKMMNKLSETDKQLPQVHRMLKLCLRGFAVHHLGVLPFLKELVEILLMKNLIKFVFATETFAMCSNLPIRVVVFDDLQKYADNGRRILTKTEYTEMSGRAGFRSAQGQMIMATVVVMSKAINNGRVNECTFPQMVKRDSVCLMAQYRVTCSMLLAIAKDPQLRVADILSNQLRERANRKKEVTPMNNVIYISKFEKFMEYLYASCVVPDPNTSDEEDKVKENCLKAVPDTVKKLYYGSKESYNMISWLMDNDYIEMDAHNRINDCFLSKKGKAAYCISHMGLFLTELIFAGELSKCSVAEIGAILSVVTCTYADQRAATSTTLSAKLCGIVDPAWETVREFEDGVIRKGLMEVVYTWIQGASFGEVMGLTEAQEGVVCRCLHWLSEVSQDVRNAAVELEDTLLVEKMDAVVAALLRDIPFVASLHTDIAEVK